MNKRQKKKQLAVWYRKDYKALRKFCQRRKLTTPEYDWSLPSFQKWKKGIIFQNRCMKIFGLPESPIYPQRILGLMASACIKQLLKNKLCSKAETHEIKYSEHDVKVTSEVLNNEYICKT